MDALAPLPSPAAALGALWQAARLEPAARQRMHLQGCEPVLPSSFAVGTAAQAATAAGALAAAELGRLRNGLAQQVTVDMRHAALECCTHFLIDGQPLPLWDKLSGPYPCGGDDGAAGWVRIHTNFAHHRDGALRLLGLPTDGRAEPADLRRALQGWSALGFEQAAADAGLVAAAFRRFDEWDAHPQGEAVAQQALLHWTRLGDAPPRVLPAHGADVLLVNSPQLPNIEAIAETSRGKRSAHANLHDPTDRVAFDRVLGQAHVFAQGYRPGALAQLGYGAPALGERYPGLVIVSLSAHGPGGPWAGRRGFGRLSALRHAAQLSHTPTDWPQPSMSPGTHPLAWPVDRGAWS
jgi:crotonobetainyl-CoA:carnitine CoA-transferase CaiB-like acyl-CoA transferase